MAKHGKKYLAGLQLIDRNKEYMPREALALVKKAAYAKFNETVEVHFRLNVDPRHADQIVRGVVLLPNGLGKEVKVLVFAEGEAARLAEEAGADFVGSDDLVAKIQGGWVDFDMAIATPEMMRKVGRLGRILGPRGLMPTPKAGTVTKGEDLPRVIKEARLGRIEFRVDRGGNLHVPIGKVQFTEEQLTENFYALFDAILRAKPAVVKGKYIRKLTFTSTMGPAIRVDALAAQAKAA